MGPQDSHLVIIFFNSRNLSTLVFQKSNLYIFFLFRFFVFSSWLFDPLVGIAICISRCHLLCEWMDCYVLS